MSIRRDPHRPTTFRLRTFGGLSLLTATGSAAGQQRRRLALLALLATARERGMTRDRLVSLLSPESSTDAARHSLHQLLYYLRQQVGEGAFVGTDPLRLNPAIITSDVSEFEEAIERGEPARAAAIYGGPFLDGFHLNLAEFEEWVASERQRLATMHRDGIQTLARETEAAGDYVAAIKWWRQLAVLDPLSGSAALGVMRTLAAAGDVSAAISHARVHAAMVHAELGRAADSEVEAFVARLQVATSQKPSITATSNASSEAGRISRIAEHGEGDGPAFDSLPQSVTPRSRSRSSTSLVIGGVGAAVGLALVVALPSRRVQRLAVLPLRTTEKDSIARLVADGLTDEMISALTRAGIAVIGYRSVSGYTSSVVSLREVERALSVDAVATGALVRRGRTIELSLEVSNPRTGETRWRQSITADSADISTLPSAAAGSLAGWILGSDAGFQSRPTKKPPITSPEAYSSYLLGMRAVYRATAVAMKQSLDLLESAIVKDSTFAAAHAGLGLALTIAVDYGILPGDEAFRRAEPIIARSIALDSTLALAHLARARLLQLRDWDWKGAEAEYLAAIDLEPNAQSFQMYGWFLEWYVGRTEDGVAMGQRAVELEPGSAWAHLSLAWRLRGANQLEPAAHEAHIALGLDSTAIDAYWILAEVFLRRGDYREAEKYARRFVDTGSDVPANSTTLGEILARSGQVTEANAYAARLSLLATRDGPSLVALARTEMALGREERALSLLERAVRERVFTIPFQPYWDPIRDTPRFRALMRAQGL
jgi:DNA-binding SARP family transcriptional activator/TolB-like protein/Tfp pilus assembly protein PilF